MRLVDILVKEIALEIDSRNGRVPMALQIPENLMPVLVSELNAVRKERGEGPVRKYDKYEIVYLMNLRVLEGPAQRVAKFL